MTTKNPLENFFKPKKTPPATESLIVQAHIECRDREDSSPAKAQAEDLKEPDSQRSSTPKRPRQRRPIIDDSDESQEDEQSKPQSQSGKAFDIPGPISEALESTA